MQTADLLNAHSAAPAVRPPLISDSAAYLFTLALQGAPASEANFATSSAMPTGGNKGCENLCFYSDCPIVLLLLSISFSVWHPWREEEESGEKEYDRGESSADSMESAFPTTVYNPGPRWLCCTSYRASDRNLLYSCLLWFDEQVKTTLGVA